MKNILISFVLCLVSAHLYGQSTVDATNRKAIQSLIDKYSQARETKDTILLKAILVPEVDQLVSNGEWRHGIAASVKGMLSSSTNNPGTRMLTVDKMRLLNPSCGIVDCRYEIQNQNGTTRSMWSTFVVVLERDEWKISAIRNMLPAK